MIVRDWRELPADSARALYVSEAGRWRDALAWDTSTSWDTVEEARTTWGLPGLVCVDTDGTVRGWTFYMMPGDRIDVGGFSADSSQATETLVEALLDRGDATLPLSGLLYETAPGLVDTLRRRGVEPMRYSYLAIDPGVTPAPAGPAACLDPGLRLRAWSLDDLDITSHLLHDAHDETTAVLPSGSGRDDWRQYVTNLALYRGCGTLAPLLSFVACEADRPVGVALVSLIAEHTAHLVQCAVHPDRQGRGVGRMLLGAVIRAVAQAGHRTLTLLVAEGNGRALRMYRRAGFVRRGTFVSLQGDAGIRSRPQ